MENKFDIVAAKKFLLAKEGKKRTQAEEERKALLKKAISALEKGIVKKLLLKPT